MTTRRAAISLVLSVLLIGTVFPADITPAFGAAPSKGRAFRARPVSQPIYGVKPPSEDPERQTHFVEGAGGTDIFVETWLPKASAGNVPPKRIPTVLVITPYTGLGYIEEPRTLDAVVPRGYAYSQMHVRGTGRSGGCLEQFSSNEVADAANVIEYLGRDAPWSNGKVGGSGLSYPGISLVMVAGRGDPKRTKFLKALIAGGVASSQYEYNFMDGVPFTGAGVMHSAFYNTLVSLEPSRQGDGVRYSEKPACIADVMVGSASSDGDVTPFWADRDHRAGVKNIRAASFIYHGHYDSIDTPIALAGLFDELPAGTPKHALIGAFGHNYPYSTGTAAWNRLDFESMQIAWLDRYLKGLDSKVELWPTVQVQGMDGQWRAEKEWPTTTGPVGHLALGPEGALGTNAPEGVTTYREAGSYDYLASLDGSYARFTTPKLPDELHVTGLPVVDLWVRLSQPDAHIAAMLEVVNASGQTMSRVTTYGFRSARHLAEIRDNRFVQAKGKPAPVGEPVRIQVRLNPTDLIVPAGGHLRLTIGGASWGTSGVIGISDLSGSFTEVSILHDCEHPSMLRFLMPKERPDLLNVLEVGESPDLPSTPSGRISVTGGGLATRRVCGDAPERLALMRS